MHPGWIGGIVGSVVGLAGGIVGTWAAIRHTEGPKERAFMVRASIVVWALLLLFFALMIGLPSPWRHLVWIPTAVLLPLGILRWNRRLQEIRTAERRDAR